MHAPTDFKTLKTVCIAVGVPALAASCFMTWKFGHSISFAHGVGLALATVMAAIIFALRAHILAILADHGLPQKGTARALMALGCFFVFFEFVGDLGYTFGMRDKQIVEAGAQNVAYDAVQDNLKSERQNVDMWRKQLETLTAQNAWATTVSADGLKAKLAGFNLAIEQEAARGGCKAKCLARTKERDEIASQIATIEKVDNLTKQIAATQKLIDGKVQTATTTNIGHSTAKAQDKAFARIGLLLTGANAEDALKPGEAAQQWSDYILGLLMAIGACALPPVAFYFGFWQPPVINRKPTPVGTLSPSAIAPEKQEARAYPPNDKGVSIARTTVGERNRMLLEQILKQGTQAHAA